MSEKEFIVRALLEYEYRVKAENADEAAQIMTEGEAGRGQCVGYSIEAVVSADKANNFWHEEDDERAKCTCGHLLHGGHNGLWSGEAGKWPKPHPNACDTYGCKCLDAVEAVGA